jgi:hypothetical protein
MKTLILAAVSAAAALAGGAALAQPYYGYDRSYPAYAYDHGYAHGYDRDRDHDGVPDRWDRYDDRRDWRWREHRHDRWEWRRRFDRW